MIMVMDPVARATYERDLDFALAGSFPASDPLPWTLGMSDASLLARTELLPRPRAAVVEVVLDARSSRYRRLSSLAEVFALAMLVPIGILLVGLPIVAAVRATVAIVMRLNP